jgi:hypothetical protein
VPFGRTERDVVLRHATLDGHEDAAADLGAPDPLAVVDVGSIGAVEGP